MTLLDSRTGLFLPQVAGVLVTALVALVSAEESGINGSPELIPVFACLLGMTLWWSSEQERRPSQADRWIAILLALLFLIPSHQLGWLSLVLMTIWLSGSGKNSPRVRNALLIIGLASLQPLLVTYLLKWFAAPVLTFDAILVSSLLKFTTGVGEHSGNIVYGPAAHQLLILRGCSSVTNLGSAWLVWFAVSRFRGITLNRRELMVVALLTLFMVGLNLLRLYSMAVDLHWHHWWHSDEGGQIYQLACACVLLITILLGVRYAGLHHQTTAIPVRHGD